MSQIHFGADELGGPGDARVFTGADHGDLPISLFMIDGRPGSGPALHRHPYPELFVVHAGRAEFQVDGERVLSCLTLAAQCEGREVTTIEGLARDGELHPLQEAFIRHDGFQCGYCTPGQIVSAVGLLNEKRPTDDVAVREWMSGNICRCGAYPNIVAAVQSVAGAQA